jgi:hypothetical protein
MIALAPEWVAAIFGLVGTLVGVLAGGTLEFLFELRREKAGIRQAKLLVAVDLQTAQFHLEGLLNSGHTPQPLSDEVRARFLPTDAWHEYKETLALKAALSDTQWGLLATLEHTIENVRFRTLGHPPRTPLSTLGSGYAVDDIREMVTSAELLYHRLTGEHSYPAAGSRDSIGHKH